MKYIFVVARQRSGTNFFRGGLEFGNDDFLDCGEVLQKKFGENFSFRSFLKSHLSSYPNYVYREPTALRNVFLGFLEWLSDEARKQNPDAKCLIVDVKYDNVGVFDSHTRYWVEQPNLLSLLQESQIPFVHLVRENTLELVLSNMVAAKSKVWTACKDQDVKSVRFPVDPSSILSLVEKSSIEIEAYKSWVNEIDCAVEFSYESLSSGLKLDEYLIELADLSGFDDLKFRSKHVKLVKRYSEVIENWDEIITEISKTQYSYFKDYYS